MTTLIWTIAFVAALGFLLFQLWGRFGVLLKLRRDDGRDYSPKTLGSRIWNLIVFGFLQKKFFLRDQVPGLMHVIVFWGFCVLSVQVITMFGRGWIDEFRLPFFGMDHLGGIYGLKKDIFELLVLGGVGIALFRWTLSKPRRLMGILPAEAKLNSQSHLEAKVILVFIATIMLTGLLYDAGRMVFMADDAGMLLERQWQPISALLASLLDGNPELARTVSDCSWWIHNLVILCFMNVLPRSKHFHIITALPNVFFGRVESKGRLAKKNYAGENPLFGRSIPTHFTWKQALDMYSCTECGRCSSVCPAAATQKTLAPRQFLLNLRDTLYANQGKILSGATDGFDVVVGDGKAVMDDVVWSCVECRACEEACPVNIEYVDKIVDIRQHLVQEASRFPAELNRAFQGMERNSNPWGIAAAERTAWAEGMNAPDISTKKDAEYLYYVGCGGSFDEKGKKSTQAFVKILNAAGVNYGILGARETCNGETARRLGNEYLFQTMAEALTNTINSTGVKKIIVNCPHCLNTFKNDYPEFGGKWEIIAAATLVKQLVAEGKIKTQGHFNKNVVYHDSCNYGRYNDIYEEPRDILKSVNGVTVTDPATNRDNGTCCGAGGGRMWLEEEADKRVNVMRTQECLDQKPDVIATSCPFCRIMIGSGVNEKGLGEKVAVMDVMEIVANNLATN